MPAFKLTTDLVPRGDQPRAIKQLTERFLAGERHQTLLGVTGSGKTFTMAHVIAALGKPTLVISHNKTLAAQLYAEFKDFFKDNAVAYFVSYYDYYQPEAYIPQKDIYIEKDASINEQIDRLRLAATGALSSRKDVIIVASVSCIYGLGSPEEYREMTCTIRRGDEIDRTEFLLRLVDLQYERNDVNFKRRAFRVRGDTIDVFPAYEEFAYSIQLFGDEVDVIAAVDPLTGELFGEKDTLTIYPAKHYVMPSERIEKAVERIEAELAERLGEFKQQGKLLEAQRLEARTRFDIEMMKEVGYCPGIENYSRHLSGRAEGEPPWTLIDYFPEDFFLIIDESHVTIPQLRGMFEGDHSRKKTLVEHGFRLPSALDNRPLRFDEFEQRMPQTVFVSATPGPYELQRSKGVVVEQIIRPTGLVDPAISVRSARDQVVDLQGEVAKRVAVGDRVLVTTLTKRLAEELSIYLKEEGFRARYLHSEIETIERVEILRRLREGDFDVLVGVNLLREGLDLPEVSLVAILDADKEGFLRSETSLIQTIGRTARNVNAEVILYADRLTDSMKCAIDETNRRRKIQLEYNAEHGITPTTIRKEIRRGIEDEIQATKTTRDAAGLDEVRFVTQEQLKELEQEMMACAERLEFEEAARIRDLIEEIREKAMVEKTASKRRKAYRRRIVR